VMLWVSCGASQVTSLPLQFEAGQRQRSRLIDESLTFMAFAGCVTLTLRQVPGVETLSGVGKGRMGCLPRQLMVAVACGGTAAPD
jgi:hypothetical protein